MPSRIPALLVVATMGSGCARGVPLSRGDLDRLAAVPEIPVLYRMSPSPSVDCPGDEGEKAWSSPDHAFLQSPPRPTTLAREDEPGGRGLVRPAGTTWEDVQSQRTESLRRAPPGDPARATADSFLSLSHGAAHLMPFRESALPVESADPPVLTRRFGSGPALVFEATRWVLVGCWYTYQPWFNVRATLVELGSGKVLWRDACGRLYPPDLLNDASPGELEANGKALYSGMIEARARRCAGKLFSSLTRGADAGSR